MRRESRPENARARARTQRHLICRLLTLHKMRKQPNQEIAMVKGQEFHTALNAVLGRLGARIDPNLVLAPIQENARHHAANADRLLQQAQGHRANAGLYYGEAAAQCLLMGLTDQAAQLANTALTYDPHARLALAVGRELALQAGDFSLAGDLNSKMVDINPDYGW